MDQRNLRGLKLLLLLFQFSHSSNSSEYFLFSLYPSPEIKQVTGFSDSYNIDLCICLQKFFGYLSHILLPVWDFRYVFCMKLIVMMMMIVCLRYYARNFPYYLWFSQSYKVGDTTPILWLRKLNQ